MRAGCEANQKYPGGRIAKPRHWFRPVVPIEKRTPLDLGGVTGMIAQARTPFAGDHVACDREEWSRDYFSFEYLLRGSLSTMWTTSLLFSWQINSMISLLVWSVDLPYITKGFV